MAKASWLKVTPSQGSGNASVSVSSLMPNTGRNVRSTTLTWVAANVENTIRTVNQAGKPGYVDIAESAMADKGGKNVTITGISNAKGLTFSLGSGNLEITLPPNYTANSVLTLNGKEITGDPGATAEYPFSITIAVPANDTIESKTRQIIVEDADGHRDVCLLTSAAGDAYVTVPEGAIEIDYLGNTVTIAIQSNTTWTIE